MTTIPPVSTVNTSTSTATTSMDGPGGKLDRDAFLKLLVAQLKYQDPTKPADASEMLAQSAQLTMVDRLNTMATEMASSAVSQRLALASSIVGKEITFLDADSVSQTAVVAAARVDGDDLVLTAGDYLVPMTSVTSIRSAPVAAAATGSNATTTATTATGSSDTTTGTSTDTGASSDTGTSSDTATTTDTATSSDTTTGTDADTTATAGVA